MRAERTFFFNQGYEPAGGTPEEFGRLLAEEVTTWSKVIRTAKIQFD
jgi:tripartite-type tricarboxylate transporter receptor subunit TctC